MPNGPTQNPPSQYSAAHMSTSDPRAAPPQPCFPQGYCVVGVAQYHYGPPYQYPQQTVNGLPSAMSAFPRYAAHRGGIFPQVAQDVHKQPYLTPKSNLPAPAPQTTPLEGRVRPRVLQHTQDQHWKSTSKSYGILQGVVVDFRAPLPKHHRHRHDQWRDHFHIRVKNPDAGSHYNFRVSFPVRALVQAGHGTHRNTVQYCVKEFHEANGHANSSVFDNIADLDRSTIFQELGTPSSENDFGNLNLDYLRTPGLIAKNEMTPAGDGNGLIHELVKFCKLSQDAQLRHAKPIRVYALGKHWGPEGRADDIFHFTPGYGMHDVHMNQGDDNTHVNEKYKDGALMFHFPESGKWVVFFASFDSQCWDIRNRA